MLETDEVMSEGGEPISKGFSLIRVRQFEPQKEKMQLIETY